MEYCGQWKQDQVLNEEVFKGKREGFFVEIGCASPVRINNSYFFEKELGWKGVCVDARKSACEEFASVRSAQVIHAAVGATRGRSVFMDFGLLAGLVKYMGSHEHETIEQHASKAGKVDAYWVDVIPFSDIRAMLPEGHLDLLMIDTEGAELPILKAMDNIVRDFSVVMAESNTNENRTAVEMHLGQFGFRKYKRVGMDTIFLNEKF